MSQHNDDTPLTYASAGVDIDAGNSFVDKIKPLAASTKRPGADGALGGFGALFDMAALDYKDPVLVSATDGVGTKLMIAIASNIHNTVGIDLVAMCVNDLIAQGAEPLFFLDYFATGKLKPDTAALVVEGIAEGCKQAGCALVGGETAELPGMYGQGEYDLAGFSVGVVERSNILPKDSIQPDDVLIGLSSSGVHSNGFSLVRKALEKNGQSFDMPSSIDGEKSWAEMLLTPTRIYVKPVLKALKTGHVKAVSHITGGGFTDNIPRILPSSMAAKIHCNKWPVPEIFSWIATHGNVQAQEMLRTFNCGIGLVLVVSAGYAKEVENTLIEAGETPHIIGKIVPREEEPVHYEFQEAFEESLRHA